MTPKSNLFHDVSIRIVRLINIIFMTLPFVFAWYGFYADQLWVHFFMRGHWLIIGLYILMYFSIGRVYDAFLMSYNSKGEMVYSQILSLFEVNVFMYIVAWLLIRHAPAILPVLCVFCVQIVFSIIWCSLSQTWYYHTFPANKTVVVWDKRQGISQLIDDYNLSRKFKVVATISAEECKRDISVLNDADAVFLVGVQSNERGDIIKYCLLNNIKSFLIPRVGDLIITGARRTHMFHLLLLKVERYNPTLEYLIAKRIGDIVLSLIALVLFSPIILVTAICIKLEDHGPIIYKQCRLTKDGKEFDIYKFRSMKTNAEEDGIARLSTGDDDERVTKIGKLIRRVRIDELPQLFNILKGELTIVGPRAERPELVKEYQEKLPEFELRLQAKAGLTGYAQVYGKYNTTPHDKLLMDLMYIANASVFEDIRIIVATAKILFMIDSTEGIEKGQKNAMSNSAVVMNEVSHNDDKLL